MLKIILIKLEWPDPDWTDLTDHAFLTLLYTTKQLKKRHIPEGKGKILAN